MSLRRRHIAKKPRPNFVPRGQFTAVNSGPAVSGTFGAASKVRKPSPAETAAVIERLRNEGIVR